MMLSFETLAVGVPGKKKGGEARGGEGVRTISGIYALFARASC
jgi:hypothetical protein